MALSSLEWWAAAALASSTVTAEDTGRALMLWLIVAGGLLVFLVAVVLVSLSRRAKRPAKSTAPTTKIDAWKAAAERIEPPALPEED